MALGRISSLSCLRLVRSSTVLFLVSLLTYNKSGLRKLALCLSILQTFLFSSGFVYAVFV